MNNQNRQKPTISIFRYKGIVPCMLFAAVFFQLQCSTDSDTDTEEEQEWQTGEVYQDENGWVEARVGNLPLVISAPHGGTLQPDEVPDRSCEGITTVRDRNTTELALQIEQALESEYNQRPYVVAAYISRKKIDLNRDIGESTCGNITMEEVWHQYHEYIETALSMAIEEFGYALLIDLHGHGHDKQRLELGYALTKSEIRDAHLDESAANDLASESSLRNLFNINSEVNLQDLLTGEYAFGTLMEGGDIPSVPSLDDPYPLDGDPYFTGGYNTRRYASSDYPRVLGWQIEANYQGLRESVEGREKFSETFAKAIDTFIDQHVEN